MYRHIDCALLALPAFQSCTNRILSETRIGTVQLHSFPLHQGTGWTGHTHARSVYDDAASLALVRAAPALQRFDVCVLPVMPASLGWTRVALARAQPALAVPVIVLARDLTAPALRDLLSLGAADFVPESAGVEELNVRLTQWASKRRRQSRLDVAEGDVMPPPSGRPAPGRPAPAADAFARTLHRLASPDPSGDSFRATRAHVLAEFERDYVTSMLMRYRGNVTHAARAGNQDRRAFWQLMRKYRILSADFRSDYPVSSSRPLRSA